MNKFFPSTRACSRLLLIQLTALLLVVTGLSPNSRAHAAAQTKKVSISLSNVPFQRVFDEITKNTGYTFLYNNVQIDPNERVSVSAQGEEVGEVLSKLFAGRQISYSLVGNQIVLTRRAIVTGYTTPKDVKVHVSDLKSKEPLVGAVLILNDYAIYGVTDNTGTAVLKNVPVGPTGIEIRLLGYKTQNLTMNVGTMTEFYYKLEELSLSMRQVTVLGTQTPNTLSNSITIDAQAIEHLQAVTLDDLLELIPGSLSKSPGDRELTGAKKLSFRNIKGDDNNSFGAALIVDGVQLSTNNLLSSEGGGTGIGVGTSADLRWVGTDDIESVEVVLGVPSVEYGDLSSGAMIVKTKIGESDWRIRAKLNPSNKQGSVTKGWKIGEKNSTINMSFDYLTGGGDPRNKTRTVDRINTGVGFGKQFSEKLNTTTRFKFSSLRDWNGSDPDAANSVSESKSNQYNFTFSHEGTLSVNRKFSRSITYNVNASYTDIDQWSRSIKSSSSTYTYLINATESGIHEAIILPKSYVAKGGTKNNPLSASAKVVNNFFIKSGEVNQRFKAGVDFTLQKNYGDGTYNEDPGMPLYASGTRNRRFIDIPATNRLSAFIEDNLSMKVAGKPLSVQLGLRYDALQPGRSEFVQSLSPRANLHYDITKWLTFKAAYGRLSKTPGMDYLYPDKKYNDYVIVEHMPNAESEQLVMYQTNVIDVKYSDGLKNSYTNKYEVGFNLKLPKRVTFSATFYYDENKNGFENSNDKIAYLIKTYSDGKGYTANTGSGQKPTIDFLDPNYAGDYAKSAVVYHTLGTYINTACSRNLGVEFTLSGRIRPINTEISFSGAYRQTRLWSTKDDDVSPHGIQSELGMGSSYAYRIMMTRGSGSKSEQFSSSLNFVWHIPQLSMVASGRFQVCWYTYENSGYWNKYPTGWFRYEETSPGQYTRVDYPLTQEMITNNVMGPEGKTTTYEDNIFIPTDRRGSWRPSWVNFDIRVSKTIADFIGFSFYANNATYHLPWYTTNKNNTKNRRGNELGFGAEISFKF